MADKAISELKPTHIEDLPSSAHVYDEMLFAGRYQGDTVKVSGRQLTEYLAPTVNADVEASKKAAESAGNSAAAAGDSAASADEDADRAETARRAIENLTVTAKTLLPGEAATVTKTLLEGFVNLLFGIPRGLQGATGPKGEQGIQGERGLQGPAGVVAQMMGLYAFYVNGEGHLILTYDDSSDPPHFELRENGHLYYIFEEAA